MKNSMQVWKVLTSSEKVSMGVPARISVGVDHSGKFTISYPVGKFIKPKVGKIFCFKSRSAAEKYISKNMKKKEWSIHKAIAINPKPIFTMSCDETDIKRFWNGQASGYPAPEGSYMCDSLKCID